MKLPLTLGLMFASAASFASNYGDSFAFSCYTEVKGKTVNIAGTFSHTGDKFAKNSGTGFNRLMMKRDNITGNGIEASCTINDMYLVPDGTVTALVDCGRKVKIIGRGFTKDMQEIEGMYGGSRMEIYGRLGDQDLDLSNLSCESSYRQSRPRPQTLTTLVREDNYDINQVR